MGILTSERDEIDAGDTGRSRTTFSIGASAFCKQEKI
jgi:hypothetical protein